MNPISTALALAASLAICFVVEAGQPCCHGCGCRDNCGKVCRLVCDIEEVTQVIYGCKCEDFCIPGPSSRCKQCTADCCNGCPHKTYHWTPGAATLHTRKVLVKKEVKIQKPTYKWVVQDLCPRCQCNAVSANYPPHAAVPLPPVADAQIIYAPNPVPDTAEQ